MALPKVFAIPLTAREQEGLESSSGPTREVRQAHDDVARRYAPVFIQSVRRYVRPKLHRPWRDFIVAMDFDSTAVEDRWRRSWLEAQLFHDPAALQAKADAMRRLEGSGYQRHPSSDAEGILELRSTRAGFTPSRLDLRPVVYYSVITTREFTVCHYVVYHTDSVFSEGQDMPGGSGYHPGDLEGSTVIVDNKSEEVLALITVFHNEVKESTFTTDHFQWRYFPSFLEKRLAYEDLSAVDENGKRWRANDMRNDSLLSDRPLRHCYVRIESGTHAQTPNLGRPNGPALVYYLDNDDNADLNLPLAPEAYGPEGSDCVFVPYHLVYIGSSRTFDSERPTMWGAYHDVRRVGEGMNAPWHWSASNHPRLRRPWWPNPIAFAFNAPIGSKDYTVNPYLPRRT